MRLTAVGAFAMLFGAVPAVSATYALSPADDTYVYSGEPALAHGDLSGLATGFIWPHSDAVLAGQLRIRQAMGRGQSMNVRLTEPLSVLIVYGTTLVKDGRIYFYDDIYGHDRVLDAALRERTLALPPPDHRTSLPQPMPATAAR